MLKREMDEVSATLLKGRITELKCEEWFLEQGYVVSIPTVPNQYDFLADVDNEILKIQVKSCRLKDDGSCLVFNVSSMTHNQKGYTKRTYSKDAVDYFMTEYNDVFYLIPFESCGTSEKKLRLIPTKNGQTKGISFAKDYLAEDILKQKQEQSKEEVIN